MKPKLDGSFSDSLFKINGYQFPFLRRDRDNRGGEKIVSIKQGLIANRLKQLETKISETIFLELTISNKKWPLVFPYRPPNNANKQLFFNEVTESLTHFSPVFHSLPLKTPENLCFSLTFSGGIEIEHWAKMG